MNSVRHIKLLMLTAVLAAFLTVQYTWLYNWNTGRWGDELSIGLSYIAVDAIVLASLLDSWKKAREATRLFWLLLAAGCLNFLLGDAILFYKQIFRHEEIPLVSWADVFFLLFMLCYATAFFYKVMHKYDIWKKLFILCDLAITMTVAATLEYYTIVQRIWHLERVTAFSKMIQLAYPALDLLLLLFGLSLYFRPVFFSSRRVLYCLILAVIGIPLTDFLYDYLRLYHSESFVHILNPLFQVSLLFTAMAGALNETENRIYIPQVISKKTEENIRAALPYAASILLGLFTVFRPEQERALLVGLCLTFAFVLIRHTLTERQNRRLMQKQEQNASQLESRIERRTAALMKQRVALTESEQRFRSLYEHHPDPIYTLDLDGNVLQSNRAGILLLGYEGAGVGLIYEYFIYREDLPAARKLFQEAKQGLAMTAEVRAHHRLGDVYHLSITAVPLILQEGLSGIYFIVKNITDLKEQRERINYLAYHDPLTGLYNRAKFTLYLEEAVRNKEPFSLFFIDLDRFKTINDTLGHDAGDAVLKEASRRLRHCVPPHAVLARLGGDEFTVLLPACKSNEAEAVAAQMLQVLQPSIRLEEHRVHVTPSIGIALYPDAGQNAGTLLRHADMAMYHVKSRGKNSFAVYNLEISREQHWKLQIEKELYEALQHGGLSLMYQPQIDAREQRILGWEALVRWEHPELGRISPLQFIAVAEETGLIHQLGKYVLHQACRQIAAWRDMGYTDWRVAVNLSVKEFRDAHFIEKVTAILQETGLEPHYLELELTERIAMEDEEDTLQKLRLLKDLGVHLSIDDFGTGYSSLSYLPLYPVDQLKIARELVTMAEKKEEGRAIVAAILSLARTLGLSTIAEGVETKEQMQLLLAQGCRHIQGYFFSKPLPPEECVPYAEAFSKK